MKCLDSWWSPFLHEVKFWGHSFLWIQVVSLLSWNIRCREPCNSNLRSNALLGSCAVGLGLFEYLCSKGWRNKLNDIQEWTNNNTPSSQFHIKYENGCTETFRSRIFAWPQHWNSKIFVMISTKSGKWHVPQTNLAVRNGTLATWNKSKCFWMYASLFGDGSNSVEGWHTELQRCELYSKFRQPFACRKTRWQMKT